MFHILICDDDADIRAALRIYLESEGYAVSEAADGEDCLAQVERQAPDLALLDVMMPKLDGIHTIAHLRQTYNFPIILLTAKGEDADKILGLNIGADDYVTKPFNPIEVLARVKSQLRRFTTLGGRGPESEHVLRNGGLVLDDKAKTVTVDGDSVTLTPIEFHILQLLMSHPGQVFSAAHIYESVWQNDAIGSEGTVAVHIRHLREKIEIDPANPRYIKVVWGLGYKMEEQP